MMAQPFLCFCQSPKSKRTKVSLSRSHVYKSLFSLPNMERLAQGIYVRFTCISSAHMFLITLFQHMLVCMASLCVDVVSSFILTLSVDLYPKWSSHARLSCQLLWTDCLQGASWETQPAGISLPVICLMVNKSVRVAVHILMAAYMVPNI